jgi:hypothetical protein
MSKLFHNKRKAEEIGFQSFLLFAENNHFDVIANKAIVKHEKKLSKLNSKTIKNELDDTLWQIIFIEEELKAIAEMKIIYAYKHFETCLKFMLQANYQINGAKYHRWENIREFLTSKNIKISEIECSREMDELREVNNAIKHSNILSSRIIPQEFVEKDSISYQDIIKFYNRIDGCVIDFFKSLYSQIVNEKYAFTKERLNEMANEIERKMEPEKAIELANNIISRYK